MFHARLRGRARSNVGLRARAKAIKVSAVSPASRALEVPKIGNHHLTGMELRLVCDHLRAATTLEPISAASLSGDSQSSTTSRKVSMSGAFMMPDTVGQSVPKVKARLSRDKKSFVGQDVLMGDLDEDEFDSAWGEAFRQRIRDIQGKRTQEQMAELLGISRDRYAKYVGSRKSKMPIWLLPKLAAIGAITLEELISGPKPQPAAKSPPVKKRKAS